MDALDSYLEGLAQGGSAPLWVTLCIALLLGLRHATDPDHLAAVSALVAHDADPRSAGRIGRAWGLGHAVTMLLFGLPVVLFAVEFPEGLYHMAEALVGALIMIFAVRLLGQSLSGRFHFHGHQHPHTHQNVPTTSSTWQSFGVGVVHGIGGSYGGALLVLATFHSVASAAFGLLLFTSASILSMTAVTWVFARMVTHHRAMHVVSLVMPVFALLTFGFGLSYLHAAVS